MKRSTQTTASPELAGALSRVKGLLLATCLAFASDDKVQALIGNVNTTNLLNCLDGDGNLCMFNWGLRQCVCDCSAKPGFDSTPFWTLVDAIGSWSDAHPGRWPYMNEEGHLRSIGWSMDYATQVAQSLLH